MKYKVQSGNWAFILHRLTGIILIGYLLVHILVLTSMYDPAKFAEEMELLTSPAAKVLEYLLFLPILFHSINGIRLIIVEWTDRGSKNHKKMLGAVYAVCTLLAVAMGIIFLTQHKPYDVYKQDVDEYTKRAIEHVKK